MASEAVSLVGTVWSGQVAVARFAGQVVAGQPWLFLQRSAGPRAEVASTLKYPGSITRSYQSLACMLPFKELPA